MALKSEHMKKILNIIIGLFSVVMATVSCQKETSADKTIDQTLVGEWHLTSAKAEGTSIHEGIDVYLCIMADCSFEIYQKSGTQGIRYDLYTGTCFTENGVLTGVYSNGKSWGGKYIYTKIADKLLLKTTNNIEEQTYTKCQIPAEVRENANTNTRSVSVTGSPIL